MIVVFCTNTQICMLERKKEDAKVQSSRASVKHKRNKSITSFAAHLHLLLSGSRNLYAIVYLMDTFHRIKGLQYC